MIRKTILALALGLTIIGVKASDLKQIILGHDLPVLKLAWDVTEWEDMAKVHDEDACREFIKNGIENQAMIVIPKGTTVFVDPNDLFGYAAVRIKGKTVRYFIPWHRTEATSLDDYREVKEVED